MSVMAKKLVTKASPTAQIMGPKKPLPGIPEGQIQGGGSMSGYLSDKENVAKPPAPPPTMSPNVPSSAVKDTPNVASTFRSSQYKPGFGNDPVQRNPGSYLTGEQYKAIPPSVPAPVRTQMGNEPTTDTKKGGPIKKYKRGGVVSRDTKPRIKGGRGYT